MAISLDLRAPAARGAANSVPSARQEQPLSDQLRPGQVQLRARRNPRLIAVGVLCACVGGLGGAMAYQQAGQSHAVIVVQQPVARGEVIGADDLGVTSIGSAPGVSTVPSGRLAELVGQQALVDLPRGSVLGESSVGTVTLPVGQAQLGLKVGAGRLPGGELPAGTRVLLVSVPSGNAAQAAGGSEPRVQIEAHVVTAPKLLPDGQSWTLDVAVPESAAADVAVLSATDRVVVVRKGGQ